MAKADCYQCSYRQNVSGDSHSSCQHPSVAGDLIDQTIGMIRGHKGAIQVTGNPAGVKNGWFFWPANFDPIWLESCNGFQPVEKKGS